MKIIPDKSTDNYQPANVLDQIRARRGAAGLLNVDRMLLHSPPLAEGWNTLIGKMRRELLLPAKLRELAMCSVAILNGAEYEMHHHLPLWIESGASAGQVAALRRLQQNHDWSEHDWSEFDAVERAVIRLTIEMTQQVMVADETLSAARRAVASDRALVELIGVIATYNMVSRFLVATGVEIETP